MSASDPVSITDIIMDWAVINAVSKSEENPDIFSNDLNTPLFSMDDCILSFEAPKRLDKSQGTIGTVLFVPRLSLKEGIESFLLMEYYGIRADPE